MHRREQTAQSDPTNFRNFKYLIGAARGIRTPDPVITNDDIYLRMECLYYGVSSLKGGQFIDLRPRRAPQSYQHHSKCGKIPIFMARPERFERPTPRFVVWCSIQLSYGRVFRGFMPGEAAPHMQAFRKRPAKERPS